jgi:hypothetical protein
MQFGHFFRPDAQGFAKGKSRTDIGEDIVKTVSVGVAVPHEAAVAPLKLGTGVVTVLRNAPVGKLERAGVKIFFPSPLQGRLHPSIGQIRADVRPRGQGMDDLFRKIEGSDGFPRKIRGDLPPGPRTPSS